jgi:hypothetical protein
MGKMKMLTAFCLITALLFSPLSGMDGHGANVVITKKDGTLTQEELLAVKVNTPRLAAGYSLALLGLGNMGSYHFFGK